MILVVDDNKAVRASLRLMLEANGHRVAEASTPAEAIEVVRREEPQLTLLDMNFSRSTSGDEGLTLLRQIHVFRPEARVILMTAWGTIALAVEGLKAGAIDFVTKPWDSGQLMSRIESYLKMSKTGNGAADDFDSSLIVGRSLQIQQVLETVRRVAHTDAPVLITGENGTGKELVAETIHRNSLRASAPYVKVNLGGIPTALFESEMFGHKKGAFTGAVSDRIGRFEAADGGTVFLDEIGELDAMAQVKMLRVLQEQTFEPLGSSKTRRVNVRVISATNADLPAMVANRSFREDLFYRLNLITISLPPLRERVSDIPLLVRHFAAGRVNFSPKAMDMLRALQWPGNIRELKNVVERAAIFSSNGEVDESMLRTILGDAPKAARVAENMQREQILSTLSAAGGNISRAAEALGISRQALYRRIEKFNIPLPS